MLFTPTKSLRTTGADVLKYIMRQGEFTFLTPVLNLAEQVPPLSGNILELHLNKKQNWIDFSPRISRNFDSALITGDLINFPLVAQDLTVFMSSALLREYANIENIWIEYDAPFTGNPALFFDIDRDRPFDPAGHFEKLQWLSEYFFLKLTGEQLPFFEKIQHLGLHIIYHGFMFSRNSRNARFTINGFQSDQLNYILRSLEWNGNYAALDFVHNNFLKSEQRLVLAVDVCEGIATRIGLEVTDKKPVQLGERLVNQGMVSGENVDLLNRWPGQYQLNQVLSHRLSGIHNRPVDTLYTRFNHFKFILDNSDQILTKAYLYYCF